MRQKGVKGIQTDPNQRLLEQSILGGATGGIESKSVRVLPLARARAIDQTAFLRLDQDVERLALGRLFIDGMHGDFLHGLIRADA